MDATLRLVNIVYWAMLVAAFFEIGVAEQFGAKSEIKDVRIVQLALLVVSASMLASMLIVRGRMMRGIADTLLRNPGDRASIQRWGAANIVTFALCEAVVLYGLVLRFMGGSFYQSLPFYASGIVLLLIFRPYLPE